MKKNQNIEIHKGLASTDEKEVLDTIKLIRDVGSTSLIEELIKLHANTKNNQVKKGISDLLSDLRNQEVVELIINSIKQSDALETKKMLLTACWQSRLDYTGFLEFFIDLVMNDTFEIAFEAFTVIENIEIKMRPERKQQLIAYTKDKVSILKEENMGLVHDLIPIIENYQETD